MAQSAIDRFPTSRRNLYMERISNNARRLRQGIGQNGAVALPAVGRNDSLEQLIVRLGVIPVIVLPNATSLTGTLQAPAGRRPAPTEVVNVTGPTAVATFSAGGPAQAVAFVAGGAQSLSATDPVDTAAKGRALVTIAP